jgi:hypothetical protein
MGVPTISLQKLQTIPYISNSAPIDRAAFLNPYFDAAKNQFFMPFCQGEEIIYVIAVPQQTLYYGTKMEVNDIYLQFFDDIIRYFSYPSALNTLNGITWDVINCSVLFEKYFLYLKLFRENKDTSIFNFVTGDLEFLFYNIRSMYDSLQVIVKQIWAKETKKQMPESFDDMTKKGNDELIKKYGLPGEAINLYKQAEDAFTIIKNIRDGICHYSVGTNAVFCFEDGFALQISDFNLDPIAKNFNIWSPEKTKQNGLVSVLALYAYVIKQILQQFNDFSAMLKARIPKEPMIKEEYKVFLRAPYNKHLDRLNEYLESQWIV